MLENYMLLTRGFQNVRQNDQVIGFQILVKIAYYRGVFLPLIGGFEVAVDGQNYNIDQMRFTIGHETYTFDETAQAENVRWDFGEPLKITILKSGGLSPGTHEVSFAQTIKPSYGAGGGNASKTQRAITLVR
jgi:hypothetical protein